MKSYLNLETKGLDISGVLSLISRAVRMVENDLPSAGTDSIMLAPAPPPPSPAEGDGAGMGGTRGAGGAAVDLIVHPTQSSY